MPEIKFRKGNETGQVRIIERRLRHRKKFGVLTPTETIWADTLRNAKQIVAVKEKEIADAAAFDMGCW